MRKHEPHLREEGFHLLLPHASDFVDELIIEFEKDTDHGLRCWLLELLGTTKDIRILPILVKQSQGSDEFLREWAVRGLKEMDSRESRTALFAISASLRK